MNIKLAESNMWDQQYHHLENDSTSISQTYSDGSQEMTQVKSVSYFLTGNHHGTLIIDYCDANDQEQRELFWIFTQIH